MLKLVPDLAKSVTHNTAQETFDAAYAAADKHTKTGALIRSLKIKEDSPSKYTIYHDLQAAPHAVFVHWGTAAHEIKPVNKKILRWAGGDAFIFARRVHHPGYKGDPYLTSARKAILSQFERILKDAWDKRIKP